MPVRKPVEVLKILKILMECKKNCKIKKENFNNIILDQNIVDGREVTDIMSPMERF